MMLLTKSVMIALVAFRVGVACVLKLPKKCWIWPDDSQEMAFPLGHRIALKSSFPLTREPDDTVCFRMTKHSVAPPGRTLAGTQENVLDVLPLMFTFTIALTTRYCCEFVRNSQTPLDPPEPTRLEPTATSLQYAPKAKLHEVGARVKDDDAKK